MAIDLEQLAQESAIFPWLDSDCMADECNDSFFTDSDYFYDQEDECNDSFFTDSDYFYDQEED